MKNNIFKLLLVITICFLLTGCSEEEQEKKAITSAAINYLSTKYSISKNTIEIKDNKLYGNSTICLTNCPKNEIEVEANKVKYNIAFDRKTNIFSDNGEVENITTDYIKYIQNNLKVVANISIEDKENIRITDNYSGDINKFLEETDNNFNTILVVESKTQDEAILNWRTYSTEAITALEDLDINYNLRFSVIDNKKETIIFNYKSTVSDNKFIEENNVINTKQECDRDKLVNATCRNTRTSK